MSLGGRGIPDRSHDPDYEAAGQLFRARVQNTITDPTSVVTVFLVNSAADIAQDVVSWPAKPHGALPQAGDECLVAVDDEARPWIVRWAGPAS